jgi:cysteinyl-tRNA synthetase
MTTPPAIFIYNTLTRRKQPLVPIRPGEIGMYVCGPTVYDDCHIGHLMGPALFDAVARWLHARGYQVRFVNNITDIDDKIIARSIDTGEPWQGITARYTAQYLGYLARLHVATITDHPRCSDYVPAMIAYISDLIGKGRAYTAADGVYYDVQRQSDYGKLSGRRIEDMLAGVRVERSETLRHPADFALWKLAKPNEPSWPSPWGAGRPGWHIECSVMSHETLGATFDIHGGGDDLKFPHHENEIAQGEAHGGEYAHCWMHNGLIQYQGVKVGKSDPRMRDPDFARQFKADFLLDTYGAATVRFLLLQGHYRRPNDFAPTALTAARTALGKLHRLLGDLLDQQAPALSVEELLQAQHRAALPPALREPLTKFIAEMDDDFNTGGAIAALFKLNDVCRKLAVHGSSDDQRLAFTGRVLMRDLGRLIGIFQPGDGKDTVSETTDGGDALASAMTLVLELRQSARSDRRFAVADRIRDALAGAGIVVKDAKDGASWTLSGAPQAAVDAVARLLDHLCQQAAEQGDATGAQRIRTVLNGLGLSGHGGAGAAAP